jgi:hypothetical protein
VPQARRAPHDHGREALPEYKAARRALDALVKAIDQREVTLTTRDNYPSAQAAWLHVVQQMAASLPYADTCPACRITPESDWFDWPFRVTVKGGDLHGMYRCAPCGHIWACRYAVNAPALMP